MQGVNTSAAIDAEELVVGDMDFVVALAGVDGVGAATAIDAVVALASGDGVGPSTAVDGFSRARPHNGVAGEVLTIENVGSATGSSSIGLAGGANDDLVQAIPVQIRRGDAVASAAGRSRTVNRHAGLPVESAEVDGRRGARMAIHDVCGALVDKWPRRSDEEVIVSVAIVVARQGDWGPGVLICSSEQHEPVHTVQLRHIQRSRKSGLLSEDDVLTRRQKTRQRSRPCLQRRCRHNRRH